MGADTTWQPGRVTKPTDEAAPPAALGRAAAAIAAGLVTQLAMYYFWQVAGSALFGPVVLPFGRKPDELVGVLLPLMAGLVSASFYPRGWWWLGQGMALPAFFGAHLLFAAGIEIAYSRPPTMQEEMRFLTIEGHRLIAGFVGSYFGALLQRE